MDAMGVENWIYYNWSVVEPTRLKNMPRQIGNLPQIGV